MKPGRQEEVAAILRTLRSLGAHAIAITGNREAGMAIVQDAVKRHPRPPGGVDSRTVIALLKDVTERCREAPRGNDIASGFGGDYARLPFEAKACVSLRINFDLGFRQIGPILSMSGRAAESLYGESLRRLEGD